MVLQVGALVAFVLLRLTAPGWFLAMMIIMLVGAVLPRSVAAPFVACAGFLLLGALTMPDFDDVRARAPIMVLLGQGEAAVPEVLYGLGLLGVAGWLGSLLWLVVALVLGNRPSRRTTGPAHPAWGPRTRGTD